MPKQPSIKVRIDHLHTRVIQEAVLAGQTPGDCALAAIFRACEIDADFPNCDAQVQTVIHKGREKPVLIVSGPIVATLMAIALKRHTFPSRVLAGKLLDGLEAPYQCSVFDVS